MTKKKDETEPEQQEKVEELKPETVSLEKSEWESMQAQIESYKDKNLRLLAESENTRKRLQKEKAEMQVYARESIVCEFLTPIDHFEKALSFKDQQSDEVKNWMIGFEMVLSQFKDILSQNEIFPILTEGKTFDPFYHEAMEVQETDDYPPGTIIQEFVKGYRMGERVVRPAKVKVAKAISRESNQVVEENKKSTETINHKEG